MVNEEDNLDVFTSEFRHEEVRRFVRGLIDGSIKFIKLPDLESDLGEFAINERSNLLSDIEQYVSGKLRDDKLDETESRIFSRLARMRVTDVIEETITQSQLEKEISELHSRLDSTNTLLLDILTVLKEVVKKLDSAS